MEMIPQEASLLEFQEIIQKMGEIQELFSQIRKKMDSLKLIYQKEIQQYSKKVFVFCLDSFFFKYKMMEYEMDQYSKTKVLINNRMYGDYYKLYNTIYLFHLKHYENVKKGDHLVYKDLEPLKEYTINAIESIHLDILQQCSMDSDVSINQYVNYLSFFHHQQKESLWNLWNKLMEFHQKIQEDILSKETESYLQQCIFTSIPEGPQYKKSKTKTFIISREGSPKNSIKSSQPRSRNGSPTGSRHGSPTGSRRGGKHEENSDFSYKDMINDAKSNRLFISNPLR